MGGAGKIAQTSRIKFSADFEILQENSRIFMIGRL